MNTELVQVNGRTFKIWYMSLDDRVNAIKEIEHSRHGSMLSLASTCPTGTKTVGTVINLSSSPTGGTSPYNYTFWKISPGQTTATIISGPSSSNTATYTTTATDIGQLQIGVDVGDSCPGSPKYNTESCMVSVAAQCGTPTANLTIT